jgi:hypothetical protein
MSIFVGGVVRLVAGTTVLSVAVVALGRWTHGTDATTVFVAFGCVGGLCLLVGLLEAFALHSAALLAAGAALATELIWRTIVHSHAPGEALAAGALLGMLLSLPVLLVRLVRSGGILATTLWIQ